MKPYLAITSDFTEELNDILKKFKRDEVLVGIPEDKSDRTDDENLISPLNNATILAINNFGSPRDNIPARPVMQIGIAKAQPDIIEAFKNGAKKALSQGVAALTTTYERVGIIASTSIKKVINEQEGILPPSQATLNYRKSQGFNGTKALIVTGQMRNAITYVVKGAE